MHVYRIVQEALNNAARHSAAASVRVELQHDEQSMLITVADDGDGFDLDNFSALHGIGIAGMQERARLVGGTLSIQSVLGEGTSVGLQLPLA